MFILLRVVASMDKTNFLRRDETVQEPDEKENMDMPTFVEQDICVIENQELVKKKQQIVDVLLEEMKTIVVVIELSQEQNDYYLYSIVESSK